MNDLQQVEEWLLDGTLFNVSATRSVSNVKCVNYIVEWLDPVYGRLTTVCKDHHTIVDFVFEQIIMEEVHDN